SSSRAWYGSRRWPNACGDDGPTPRAIAEYQPAALHQHMDTRPSDRLVIALAQLNPIVGDISGNAEKARRARAEAAAAGADLIMFTELFISGYPPEDLVLKPGFQAF